MIPDLPPGADSLGASSLLLLLLWVPVVAFIHELGHALMARPGGYRLASFGVGRGTPLLRHRGRGGRVYYIGRWFFAGGACVAIPRGLISGPRAALFHAGGGIAQGVLALLLALLPNPAWWVQPVATFNLLVLIWNLVPWRIGGVASDGWWLLGALRAGGMRPGLLYRRREPVRRILHFEERVGSPLGIWYARLMLAWMDLQVGHLNRADDFFSRDHPEAMHDPALDALQEALTAEWHRRRDRPMPALAAIRDTRRLQAAELPVEADQLLGLVEARALCDLGHTAEAAACLARLAGASSAAATEAIAIRLELAIKGDDPAEVELVLEQLLARRLTALMAPDATVRALWHAAELLRRADRAPAADHARTEARRHAHQLLAAARPEDRSPLLERLGEAGGLRPNATAEIA